jgi:OmpA-OmpF porin, OOP family
MTRSISGFLFSLSALFGLCAIASPARAQGTPLADFSVLRYTPAVGSLNYFSVDGGRVHGEMDPSFGLVIDYAHQPFRLYEAECSDAAGNNCMIIPGREPTSIVEYTAVAHVWAAIAMFERLQIGLNVPLALTNGAPFTYGSMPGERLEGGFAFALADPRLSVKVNALDDRSSGFRLAFNAWVTAPTGHAIAPGRYLGNEEPAFGGHLIAELVTSGFHLAINVGGFWRDGDQLFSTEATGQFTYGGAVGYEITPLFDLFAEVEGGTSFRAAVDENPLEARLGARFRVDDTVFSLGGGTGLIAGVGSPLFRVLASVAWAPLIVDEDHDNINDNEDSCPTEAEDVDDVEDTDGCPDPDNDGDGILDAADSCPDTAEDLDGEEDTDGCPDLDTDGDGIRDGYDSCPTEAEDVDNDRDDDGCPDFDTDRDNINDDVDQCPTEPEDTDGFGDEDGCPETDFDSDGITDDNDQCPDVAEDADGFEDEDGCAEEGGPPAEGPATGHHRGRGR